MNNSKFSAIMPCFNIENRLKHLIQGVCSVLNQTQPPAELLIIDDGSSDNSVELIEEYVRPLVEPILQFQFIKITENSGVSIARNLGITAAKSEYLAFIDFDDLWFPQYLESAARALNGDIDRQLVLAKTIFWTRLGGRTKARVQDFPNDINEWPFMTIIDYCMRNNFPVAMGSAVACRKAIFAKRPELMFDEFLSKETAEDIHFGCKFLAADLKPYFLNNSLVVHRTFLISSASRSQGAYLFKDELITYDYMMKTVWRALFQKLANEGYDITSLLKLQAKIRNHFLFKSNFRRCAVAALMRQLITTPRLLKQLILLLSLKGFRLTDLALNIEFARRANSSLICGSVDDLIVNQQAWYGEFVKTPCV